MGNTTDAIRGAALGPFVDWYGRAHGREGLDRALAQLSERDRRLFHPAEPALGISSFSWYPAPVIHDMLEGLLHGLGPAEREALASAGADRTMAESLDGYLGVLFRALVSPGVCATLGPRMWHAFYSGGRVRIDSQGRRCHVMRVSDWPGHHSFLCEMNNAAGRAIYRAAGSERVTTQRAACIERGDRACQYIIRW